MRLRRNAELHQGPLASRVCMDGLNQRFNLVLLVPHLLARACGARVYRSGRWGGGGVAGGRNSVIPQLIE